MINNIKISRAIVFRVLVVVASFFFLGINNSVAGTNCDIDPNALYVDKDHALASNINDGSKDLPWATIQHGINQLTAGQRLYVRASINPYFEPNRASGSNWGGITINVSGTVADPIIIEGYPCERPVIDQQLSNSMYQAEDGLADDPEASKRTAGFFLFNANNIVIRNFEITQTNASGIMFAHDRHNRNVVVEDMYIHHLYGEGNVGGIRLDHADDIIVRNNIIHDTYDVRYPIGNPYTSEIYALHAGIHGFQPGNCIIENNLIYNVSRGVFQKSADGDLKNSNTVRRNVFYNISIAAYSLQMQGTGSPPVLNAKFYENIVYDANGGVSSSLAETSSQSTGISIYNNTFYNVATIVSLKAQAGIEVYNNIISGSSSINFATERTNNANLINAVTYLDNNLYYNHANKWMLERYAVDFMEWTSLSSWRSAYTSSGIGLITNPDISSLEADPLFISVNGANFRVESNSPANNGGGRSGENLGAYGLGATVIGVIDVNSCDNEAFSQGCFTCTDAPAEAMFCDGFE